MNALPELIFTLTPSSGIPVVLTNSPDGWDENMVITERSKKYHGIFRSFTIPLKFIKDSATILRTEWYTNGYKSNCTILVQKLDRITLNYFDAYLGKIDFATFKDSDLYVEVSTVDMGLAQLIKTNESTEYEFAAFYPFDANIKKGIRISNNNYGYNFIWVITLKDMAYWLIDRITGGKVIDGTYGVKSTYLDSLTNSVVASTGQTWRTQGLQDQSSTIFKTSMSDFFKSINSFGGLGMGIEVISGKETFVIEEMTYFYNKTVICNVGKVKSFSLGVVNEFNFSKIKAGYPEKDYGDETIKNIEVNTYSNFNTSNVLAPAEYDIECKYRADFCGIQEIIDQWPTSPADENDIDYDIYLHCVQAPTVVTDTWTYALTLSGDLKQVIGSSTTFYLIQNAPITPRRNVLKHLSFINSCMFGLAGNNITFVSGGGLQSINQTAPNGEALVFESLAIPITTVGVWFYPFEIQIEAKYPPNFLNLIAQNQYGVIEFDYEDQTFQAYILRMDTKLSGSGSVKYSLLLTNDNDLTKLIR